jgi:hypothetical protein
MSLCTIPGTWVSPHLTPAPPKSTTPTIHATVARGQDRQKNNSKNENQIFGKHKFSKKSFLHGEKENFAEYFLNLAYAELCFPVLINFLAGKCQTCPRTKVLML